MAELWKAWKAKKQAFHPSHSSLGISLKPQDSHIPTAPATIGETKANRKKNGGLWESGNPKPGFPLSHSPDSLRRKENSIQEKERQSKRRLHKTLDTAHLEPITSSTLRK